MVSKGNSILVTGATGLVGKQLCKDLLDWGFSVHILSRSTRKIEGCQCFVWNIEKQEIDHSAFEGVTAIIHLAGAGVGDRRWTKGYKRQIYDSRIQSTKLLIDTLEVINHKVESFVSASAVGFYDDCGSEWITEESPMAEEFIARLCRDWEAEGQRAESLGIRYVALRIGLVLSREAGFLPKTTMTLPLRMLNYFGNGQHYYAWIHEKDVVAMFCYALMTPSVRGVYNAVAPNPVPQKKMLMELKRVLSKALLMLPVPTFALRIVLGEMARVVVFSQRVSAQKILDTGFTFSFDKVDKALSDLYSA
ncbi:MAG: TIGR01777 family oxidoreductase [Chitinophagales bacterium]